MKSYTDFIRNSIESGIKKKKKETRIFQNVNQISP